MADVETTAPDQAALYDSLSDAELYQVAARQIARANGLDPDRFEAQIATESSWKPDAVSKAGAQGLGQLMPPMQKALGVTDPFDPLQSLDAAARFKRQLVDKYGDEQTAETAYQAGETNFDAGKIGPAGRAYAPAITARVTPSAGPAQATPAPVTTTPVAQTAAPIAAAPSWRQQAYDAAARAQPSPSDCSARASDIPRAALDIAETVAPVGLMLAAPESAVADVGVNAVYGGAVAARRVLERKMAERGGSGFSGFLDAATNLDAGDYERMAAGAVIGGAASATGRWLASKLSGPAAELTELPTPPTLPPQPMVKAAPVPKPLPAEPLPAVPTDEQVAAIAAREAQTGQKATAAATLQREIPTETGVAQDAAIAEARAAVPTPNREATRAAYAAVDAKQPTPVDFTPVRQQFDEIAKLAKGRTGSTPALLDSSDIPTSGAPSEILPRIQEINGAVRKLGAEAGLRGGELKMLSHNATAALMDQLTPEAAGLLDRAVGFARTEGQLTRLQGLINVTQSNGIPQGIRGVNRLLNNPTRYQRDLGPFYDTALEWFQNIAKLQEKPFGQKIVETVARETQTYQRAIAMHADRVAAVTQANAARDAAYAANTAATQQAWQQRVQGLRSAYAQQVATLPRYQPPAGASAATRALVQAPIGAAIGGAIGEEYGHPWLGAAAGATGTGALGIPHRFVTPMIDPMFTAGFRFLANHPEGTRAWLEMGGRLIAAATARAMAGRAPQPSGPPLQPQPRPTMRPPVGLGQ